MKTTSRSLRVATMVSWVLFAGASVLAGVPQPDFHLQDVNPNSPRFKQLLSPRDYRQQVSAYYFGYEN